MDAPPIDDALIARVHLEIVSILPVCAAQDVFGERAWIGHVLDLHGVTQAVEFQHLLDAVFDDRFDLIARAIGDVEKPMHMPATLWGMRVGGNVIERAEGPIFGALICPPSCDAGAGVSKEIARFMIAQSEVGEVDRHHQIEWSAIIVGEPDSVEYVGGWTVPDLGSCVFCHS